MKYIAFAFTFFIISQITIAQDFEGTIVYEMSYSNLPKEMKDMMPKETPESILTVKGNKTRMEMNMMGFNTIVLFDGATKTSTSYMDGMGQKLKSTTPMEDEGDIEVTQVAGETKKIAGYTCKKAILKQADAPDVAVYYAEELKSDALISLNPQFKNLNGMPLEYQVSQQGMDVMVTAKKVTKESISDSSFDPPAGKYKEAPKMPGF